MWRGVKDLGEWVTAVPWVRKLLLRRSSPRGNPIHVEYNQTFVVKEIGQPVRHSGPPVISALKDSGEENHVFEASLAYIVQLILESLWKCKAGRIVR